jgi:hypothetical protein
MGLPAMNKGSGVLLRNGERKDLKSTTLDPGVPREAMQVICPPELLVMGHTMETVTVTPGEETM